jgi:hypothetical protein
MRTTAKIINTGVTEESRLKVATPQRAVLEGERNTFFLLIKAQTNLPT